MGMIPLEREHTGRCTECGASFTFQTENDGVACPLIVLLTIMNKLTVSKRYEEYTAINTVLQEILIANSDIKTMENKPVHKIINLVLDKIKDFKPWNKRE